MKRLWEGYWAGIFAGIMVLGLLLGAFSFGFVKGVDNGRDLDRLEIQRQGGGRWIEITLDGRVYQGWVR